MHQHTLVNKNTKEFNFIDNINFLIEKNKININQLSKTIDTSFMTLKRILIGEISDPKMSLLADIANYFNVSLDALLYSNLKNSAHANSQNINTSIINVPIFTFEDLINYKDINLEKWHKWQAILPDEDHNKDTTFALEATPSLSPKFRHGTLIVIDQKTAPRDGDVVLVKFLETNQYSLRHLIIDPPKWQLQPIITGSETIFFSNNKHKLVGTMISALVK
tara:strand:+ start:546 stop:1208 length:663 start_codon:yes stop_codon:yes gene_type:complete